MTFGNTAFKGFSTAMTSGTSAKTLTFALPGASEGAFIKSLAVEMVGGVPSGALVTIYNGASGTNTLVASGLPMVVLNQREYKFNDEETNFRGIFIGTGSPVLVVNAVDAGASINTVFRYQY